MQYWLEYYKCIVVKTKILSKFLDKFTEISIVTSPCCCFDFVVAHDVLLMR